MSELVTSYTNVTADRALDAGLRSLIAVWCDAEPEEVTQTRAWRSRTARLTLWSVGASPVIVKQMEDTNSARRMYDRMVAIANRLAEVPGMAQPRPIGWSHEPGCVAMPFVAAPSLAGLLSRSALLWVGPPFPEIVARVGSALAYFHAIVPEQGEEARECAERSLRSVLHRYGSAVVGSLGAAAGRHVPVHVYDDINPSHVLVGECGRISLIDVPGHIKYGYPYRDIAWFVDQLFMSLATALPRIPAARWLASFDSLRSRFVASYSAHATLSLNQHDEAAILAFESAFLRRRMAKVRCATRGPWRSCAWVPVLSYRKREIDARITGDLARL